MNQFSNFLLGFLVRISFSEEMENGELNGEFKFYS